MNYIELNLIHKQKMDTLCNNPEHFEWEDTTFMDYLKGSLPRLRNTSSNSAITGLFHSLTKKYSSYSFYDSEPIAFISEIEKIIDEIRKIEPYWSGVFIPRVEETIRLHKGCLISGEGGIGKSYFIKCLEEEFKTIGKKHLCLYGKFCPTISEIDFNEISAIAKTEEFVFIFDAINEIDEQSQLELINELKKIKDTKGLRIIITYRTHTMDESMIEECRQVVKSIYEFEGVSFESVVEWLQRIPITDINEYLDVLYSNNPFLLSKLPCILDGKQDLNKNNVSRFTYIYEQFIKKSLDKPTWENTKKVTRLLYENNKKNFSAAELDTIIDDPLHYISVMEQNGFVNKYGTDRFSFVIESLADYLIVRYMWVEISGKSKEECAQIIMQKTDEFYSLSTDTIILMLFDKFYPDYATIKYILEQTKLISDFNYNTLLKIHFKPEDIFVFSNCFSPGKPEELLIDFAGYPNKPFNCTNYLTDYYLKDAQKQTQELSKRLSGKHFLGNLKGRLKNILYFTCKCQCTLDRATENFYTAIWCSAACNSDIRNLAIKILFETIQRNAFLIKKTIDIYGGIEDDYIRDALIFVLSCFEENEDVKAFFEDLLKECDFVLAKSIKRMSVYFGKPYDYINLHKKSLYLSDKAEITEDFKSILHRVDLMEKDLFPFRFWSIDSFQLNKKFLSVPKNEIIELNAQLSKDFACVKTGICNGHMHFEDDIAKKYSVSYGGNCLNNICILSSLEVIFRNTFEKYGLPFEYEQCVKQDDSEFSASILRKCVCVSIDLFFGSLMCNYFLDNFATYNNDQESIGYEVYDPIEYGEELKIKSPLPIFQPKIEKMCDKILSHIELPPKKDDAWWKDLDLTKKNLLNILQPIEFDGHEWVLLSCRISLRDPHEDYKWKDTYDLFVCSSADETIINDGNERYLTIEIDDYNGDLLNYKNCTYRPWLCKSVPDIAYNSGLFDDTRLVLPPTEIISLLNLSLNLEEMCWYNDDGDKIICCNNNKASYYQDPITGAVFIRKDVYEQLLKLSNIKFFAFAEKYIEDKGFCPDSAFHFEIVDGKIVKAYPNCKFDDTLRDRSKPQKCLNCKHGFYSKAEVEKDREILINIIKDYGY